MNTSSFVATTSLVTVSKLGLVISLLTKLLIVPLLSFISDVSPLSTEQHSGSTASHISN